MMMEDKKILDMTKDNRDRGTGGGRVAIIEETIKTMMTEETITVMMIDEAIIIMMEKTNRIAANLPVPRKTQKILIHVMKRPP